MYKEREEQSQEAVKDKILDNFLRIFCILEKSIMQMVPLK